MKSIALALLCVGVFSGCAAVTPSDGRYMQAYSSNLIFLELDGRTERGCQALARDYRESLGNHKGLDIVCSSTSVEGALPASLSIIQEGIGAVLTGRVLSMEACNGMKSELLKQNNPNHSLSCKQDGT
jgi:hypothetical protein